MAPAVTPGIRPATVEPTASNASSVTIRRKNWRSRPNSRLKELFSKTLRRLDRRARLPPGAPLRRNPEPHADGGVTGTAVTAARRRRRLTPSRFQKKLRLRYQPGRLQQTHRPLGELPPRRMPQERGAGDGAAEKNRRPRPMDLLFNPRRISSTPLPRRLRPPADSGTQTSTDPAISGRTRTYNPALIISTLPTPATRIPRRCAGTTARSRLLSIWIT